METYYFDDFDSYINTTNSEISSYDGNLIPISEIQDEETNSLNQELDQLVIFESNDDLIQKLYDKLEIGNLESLNNLLICLIRESNYEIDQIKEISCSLVDPENYTSETMTQYDNFINHINSFDDINQSKEFLIWMLSLSSYSTDQLKMMIAQFLESEVFDDNQLKKFMMVVTPRNYSFNEIKEFINSVTQHEFNDSNPKLIEMINERTFPKNQIQELMTIINQNIDPNIYDQFNRIIEQHILTRYRKFEDLKITTITMMIRLNCRIDKIMALELLPVKRLEIINSSKTSSNKYFELPYFKDDPGSILSIRYKNRTRGIVYRIKKPFKNSLTIIIGVKNKNISIKLSSETLHICGPTSVRDGILGGIYLTQHIKHIQANLDLIKEDPNRMQREINWVKKITQGKPIIRIIMNSENREVDRISDFEIIEPKKIIFPEYNFNTRIVQFLISFIFDYKYHSDYCSKIDYIQKQSMITESYELDCQSAQTIMVNYNFSLGHPINRLVFDRLVNEKYQKLGFLSSFNNLVTIPVRIELKYDPNENSLIKKKKGKVPHHTFLIYNSGSVTQSGPGGPIMRDAYYKFLYLVDIIVNDEDYIKNVI